MPKEDAEPELVSRSVQSGIGLFTGVTIYNTAFGGLFALVFSLSLIGAWETLTQERHPLCWPFRALSRFISFQI
jgi:hypothetical protein